MKYDQKHVGLIGLGLVGSELIKRLFVEGFTCSGYDVNQVALQESAALGMVALNSPREVAASARRILLSLPNSAIVDEVVAGPEGLIHGLERGDLVIDTTTTDPERSVHLANTLLERGVHFLDATILGSSRMVAEGTALTMVGGEPDQLERAREILQAFASQIHHLGKNGKGAEAKLIVNLVLGLNRLVLAEGLLLGKQAGVDLEALLAVLQGGAAYSKVMDQKGAWMINEDFTPEARLGQHLKDVGLILDMGMKQDIKLPLTALHAQILRSGVEAGYGDLDNSAVIKALEHFVRAE
jgi:3-hydroxyisobutyrate dehydrogenase-like beta-hydroxyacid dehydrogenase